MFTQIEITTACNAKCFYCPNGTLEHKHMSWECFERILQAEKSPTMLLLYGTGEPLLHPFFWEMVAHAKGKGHRVSTITNGTIALSATHSVLLDHIGFSLDTLDEALAKRSGRTSPSKALKHLLACHALAPKKIKIYALNYGQDLAPLKAFAQEHGIALAIQQIQPKKSYQVHYTTEPLPYTTFQCSYLENEKMRYYFVDGTKAPCCFMIDATKVLPTKQIQQHLAQKNNVPSCCTQCGELTGVKRLYM
ncbi:radical SAM protein [Sulfurospirillum oryzae]|uniref:radical SAM protein n=1 Tax=Sulfurospirillum oryzae TaxID=2976535 RepID=UPI0021E770C9|nr:radical SAM protein [Sulfurospirillum oryzae]